MWVNLAWKLCPVSYVTLVISLMSEVICGRCLHIEPQNRAAVGLVTLTGAGVMLVLRMRADSTVTMKQVWPVEQLARNVFSVSLRNEMKHINRIRRCELIVEECVTRFICFVRNLEVPFLKFLAILDEAFNKNYFRFSDFHVGNFYCQLECPVFASCDATRYCSQMWKFGNVTCWLVTWYRFELAVICDKSCMIASYGFLMFQTDVSCRISNIDQYWMSVCACVRVAVVTCWYLLSP